MMSARLKTNVIARSFLLQSCWNYQGMQNIGFAFAIQPWLRTIERRGGPSVVEGTKRHLEYFNTQPYMASFVLGVTGRLEEELAAAAPEARAPIEQRISRLKAAFGSALAGVGDSLFWATLRPACAAFAMLLWLVLFSMGVYDAFGWAALAYLASYNVPALAVRWRGLALGYGLGEGLAGELKRFNWQDRMRKIRWAGLICAVPLTIAALLVPPWAPAASWWNVLALAAAVGIRQFGWPTPRVCAASLAFFVIAAAAGVL
ncbi:MAG: PTS system mannose/fructose/sorbose family transporter subunit IID [Elusimicrobia bacterium]|nr:PTS system mannose/fructose/sorbose family transporter subunit IID [Elusimicrobiota bacterium]